jgi:hypothetical protein
MKHLLMVALVALVAVIGPASGLSAPKGNLCVGGPHCYSTVQGALNVATEGDTIRIGPGTFPGGITILQSVTLVGVDAHASKLWGGGPVVTIGSTTSIPAVTLENLTIGGGATTTNVHAPNCGVDVPVCGPGYPEATAIGGGIVAFAGTNVTISNSIVTDNTATPSQTTQSVKATCASGPCVAAFGDAAGIDDGGTMTLIDAIVSDNHASAPAQSNGGGIVVEGGASLSLHDSQVTGNSAAATSPTGRFVSGGGIYVAGGATLLADGSSIDDNSARLANTLASPYPIQDGNPDQSNAGGGGVFLSDGSTATIDNSTLNGNSISVNTPQNQSAGFDAALCACGEVALTVNNTQVDRNTLTVNALASDSNGPAPATFESDGDATSITNTHIDNNTGTITTSNGGAALIAAVIFFPGGNFPTTLSNSSISNNTITANAQDGGAAVDGAGLFNNGPLVISNSTINGNHGIANGSSGSATGGGIANGLFGGPAPLTLQDSRVTENVLSGAPGITLSGGGIYTVGFPTTLTNTVVANNTPDQCEGC